MRTRLDKLAKACAIALALAAQFLTPAVWADTHDKVQLWEGGPYWATTNIGAENPEDSGCYFWWGDTNGYKRVGDTWVATDGSSANFSFGSSNTPTYYKSIATLQSEGWIVSQNGTNVLAPEHDAAQVQWGGGWRMPTYQELYDLCYTKCDWTWTTQNGVNGYIVRGRGDYASNSIFLPCAGYGDGTSLYNSGSYGYYWSSVPYSDSYSYDARSLDFYSGDHYTDHSRRYYGFSVRPVADSVDAAAADAAAANAVAAQITAIGEVAYTDESKGKIDAARAAYDTLTDDQKALVTNYATLTSAETTYAALKAAADAAVADAAVANAVAAQITAIGEVVYTDESKGKIDAARAAYDALTDAQKALVANDDTLTAAETTYAALKAAADAAAADAAAANAVAAQITAIGEVAYTDESKGKIDTARAAYDTLTDAQKALVTNYATLTAAEAAYAALKPEPETPEAPEIPETPENPETPEIPEMPETPENPETPQTPCYAELNEDDIAAPYAAEKAMTLMGAAYDGCDVVGIVELKLGKVNAKKHTSKVSGSFVGLDGKKITIKAVNLDGIDGTAPATVSLEVKGHGTMTVKIGGVKFAGSLGKYHVQSTAVGGNWDKATATVNVDAADVSMFLGTVLSDLLPRDVAVTVAGGKWTLGKAAKVKLSKDKTKVEWDSSNGNANLSGIKLTYTPKKGTFKGSFKVYALDGGKLKKHSVNVSGVVVDGGGYGVATCKKPAVSWAVTVE